MMTTRCPLHSVRISILISTIFFSITVLTSLPVEAQHSRSAQKPDLTQGGTVPEGWTHDWNLGPTGARGWIYCDKHVTTDARQILVTEVAAGSPADGKLKVGDVITGVTGKPIDDDARILFGKAITAAESEEKGGRLPLTIWREGKTFEIIIELPFLGSYSDTAPYDCVKSQRIFEQGCERLAEKMRANPRAGNEITRALNALALLASGDKKYLPVIKEQVGLLSEYNRSSGVRTWQYAYVNILLAEYVIATGDRSFVEKGLERITQMIVDGQSVVGSWGHGFIGGPHNRLEGYGMMNAPGIPLTYSLALAQRAKINVPGMDKALRKSLALIRFYVDKGSIPYGDHNPWIETHCDNGKNEMAAVLFDLESDAKATEFFSHMAIASHGAERDEGHTGNFFNMTWALLGVARSGKHATGAWLEEFSWHYDLARRWDGTFLYQGAPTPKPESYHQWDSTGAYLLAYCMPLKKTYLTGRRKSPAPQIDRAAAESLVKDGQGWTNKDRNSFYQAMETTTLIQRLKSWSPIVRERAAMELGRRNEPAIVPSLIQLLSSRDLDGQIGACQALKFQRGRAEPAIAALRKAFRSSDLWLRVMSAEALAAIGEPARKVVPELLSRLSLKASSKDPRNMEQRYLTIALFSQRNGLIGKSLESVDSKMLVKAVRASLLNQDGRARGAVATVYKNLSFKQLKPLLPAILEAITVRAPSGIMFAHEIRMAGLELFATHRISEGIELLADYALDMKPHASEHRIIKVMEMLEKYGAHAQRVIPQLEEHAQFFDEGQPDFPLTLSQGKARVVRESIGRIQASTARPKLMSLKKIR
ncbi:DUF6288 domain-containing protein [Planctomycetota bacterium]|nr:DUF6288 domain-containing protein [Planctomycetota bacterium]